MLRLVFLLYTGPIFLLVTGLAWAVPSRSFLVTGQKFRIVPGVALASQISNRLKTVDYYWCGGVIQSAALFTSCYPAKSGALSNI